MIYSFFDYSGEWSRPYRENGYIVIQIDKKYGLDIFTVNKPAVRVYGVLAAPECTDFAGSGAQYWGKKDADGRTFVSLAQVNFTLKFIHLVNPDFWALENPVGRLNNLVPELGEPFRFDPCDYGDPWTKRTCLYGHFNIPEKHPVEPEFVYASNGDRYSKIHMKTGGKSERTKEIRSITPPGFARAFYEANK